MRQREDTGAEPEQQQPKLTRKEVFLLVLQTYWVSLPYLLIFVLALLVMTWVVTSVFN